MATLSNGTFLALGKTGTASNEKIKAWIYNADGSLKAEQLLDVPDPGPSTTNDTLDLLAIDPLAVELPDGRIAITWTVNTPSSGGTYVAPWVCIYSAELEPIGVPQPVSDTNSGARDYAEAIVALADGTLVISDRNERDGHAYLRVFSPDGTRSPALDLGSAGGTVLDTDVTDIAALSDGNVAVVVRTDTSTLTGYVLTPSGSSGPSLSTPFSITPSDSPIKGDIKITALKNGGFVVTWMEQGTPGTPDFNTFMRVYNSEGGPASDAKPVSSLAFPDLLSAAHSDVLALPGGGFAVAYERATGSLGGAPGFEVHLAIFDQHGTRLADDVRVSQEATTASIYLRELHLLADGRILVRHSQGIQIVDPRTEAVSLTCTARDDQSFGTVFDDTLAGGAGDDILQGDDGNDVLDGGAGHNILKGGAGNDTYMANASDAIEDSEGSNDTVILISGSSYTMADGLEALVIAADLQGVSATGNGLNNALTGNGFSNVLDGGAGADTLDGGDGFDFASYASATSGVTIDLAAGASSDGDILIGIEGVIGSDFADTLIGKISAILKGGRGDDTYVIDYGDNQVIEENNEGIDTVRTSLAYALGANVEHLTATGTASIALTGNELANVITGNAGANLIGGGAGDDTMHGGLGDDTLDGGSGTDWLDGGEGLDFVSFASASSGVTANLSGGSGDTFVGIEGLIGSSFGDVLTGNGSAYLKGRNGDDTYVVRNGDAVDEARDEGRDTVIASGSYTLKADAEIELLRLEGVSSKSPADLTGSDADNEIIGHDGTNSLRGLGGNDILKASSGSDTLYGDAGSDTLYGGSGNDKLHGGTGTGKDVFVFDTALSRTKNVDRIYDFNPKYDSIHLENRIFTKLGKGSIEGVKFKSDMFVKGKAAKDKEDRIVYDKDTGALYYDPDGTGSKSQVKFATLSKNLKLSHGDFFVI